MNPSNKYTPRNRMQREKTTLSNHSDSGKDPVRVYCRLRPLKDNKESTCIKLLSPSVLSLTTPMESKGSRKEVHYKFKHIFTSYSGQREIFDHVAYPLIEDLLKGKNALLFTYGVTGSGKTFTLTGDENNPGIMPRCIDTIFNSIGDNQAPKYVIKSDKMNGFEIQSETEAYRDRMQEDRAALKTPKTPRRVNSSDKINYANDNLKILLLNETNLYSVFVSYIEIYNNTVFDLLDESSGKSLQSKILREDFNKNMYVNGVVEVEVKTAQEAFNIFFTGQRRKRMGDTILNAESSRSHSIFNIRIVQLEQQTLNYDGQPMIPEGNHMQISQISLVDLAGSERTNRTQTTGARLREASAINNSLMSLRNCLEILRENQMKKSNRLVPYRDTRLTQLFKNYFEGEGSVQMIICANPSIEDFEENLQVMKFGEMTQDVKIAKSEAKYTPIHKRTIEKNTVTPKTASKPKNATFTLLPEVPAMKFNFENIEDCGIQIDKLVRILKLRKNKSVNVNRESEIKIKEFRNRLLEMDKDFVLNKTEIKSLRTIIQKEKHKSINLQTKVVDLETVNDSLAHKCGELEDVVRSLQNKISEKDRKINQNCLEKEKHKHRLAQQSEKTQELDMKLKKQRDYLNAAMKAKDYKLKKVKEVLESDLIPPIDITEIQKEPNVYSHKLVQQAEKENQTPHKSRSTVATSTPSHRRRSRSAGEVWLEHNSIKPVPLGTVLQPSMKKRKSVTKLSKATDITNPKQSKYCLIAQDQDTDGEVETKVYKADILPTCGGGAQVVFNDVERLRQESPTK
ncbi:unnamed protein product [Brassicogethes aeneus]|uniref:Kinesin-like protein n=1 Tax=Brassicogethes aeneus TaxID=1431903 RepID=A0A9P0B7F8_BRAAE|nr:unnamed protein product [Brassicogethes aeneus]